MKADLVALGLPVSEVQVVLEQREEEEEEEEF